MWGGVVVVRESVGVVVGVLHRRGTCEDMMIEAMLVACKLMMSRSRVI